MEEISNKSSNNPMNMDTPKIKELVNQKLPNFITTLYF